MGVIKKTDYLDVKASTSEETLYIPSSDEEGVQNENFQITNNQSSRIFKSALPTIGSSFTNLKTHSGKKKFRRHYNVCQLLTLAEEDELTDVTIEDFVEPSKSPFTVLLEDDESFKKWDEFVGSAEEVQQKLITDEAKDKKCPIQQKINITLKNILRRKRLPIGTLQHLEDELVSFFCAMPTKIYISPELSSFERLLLHSISEYHQLKSLSFDSEPGRIRLVRVKNPKSEFHSPPLLLFQYIETMYHKN